MNHKKFKSDKWAEMCKHTLRKKYTNAANAARAKSLEPSGGVGAPVRKILDRMSGVADGFHVTISHAKSGLKSVPGIRLINRFVTEFRLVDKEFNYEIRFLETTGLVGDFRCDEMEFRIKVYEPLKGCEWMTSEEMQALETAARGALRKRQERLDLLKELVHNRKKEKGRQKVIDMYGGV